MKYQILFLDFFETNIDELICFILTRTMSHDRDNLIFMNLPNTILYAISLIALMGGFVIWDQSYWWASRDDYSFGYLVPLFSIYVLYDRKDIILDFIRGKSEDDGLSYSLEITAVSKCADYLALIFFITGGLLFFIGGLLRAATMPQNPATLAVSMGFSLVFLSTVFIFSKSILTDGNFTVPLKKRLAFTFLFLFPALIWLISAPLVSVLETKLRVFLLTQVTIIVFTVMDTLGYVIERQGNVLLLPEGVVGVEEACSGIRSLTACLFAGSFLAAVYLKPFWKKLVLITMAMIFAIITNLFRSGFLTFYAYYNGSDAINEHWVLPLIGDIGSVHDVMGMAVLILTTMGLLILLPIMNFDFQAFANRLLENDSNSEKESIDISSEDDLPK